LIAACFAAWEKIVANEGVASLAEAPLALGLGVSTVLNGTSGSASGIRGRPYIALMDSSWVVVVVMVVSGCLVETVIRLYVEKYFNFFGCK
jgi:hypothetical protein